MGKPLSRVPGPCDGLMDTPLKTRSFEPPEADMALVGRDNLTARVYQELRQALMEGRFRPGHRFKIRQLAQSLGVSETPIREALMQLVRERVLDMQAARSIAVARLTSAQYQELRGIRCCSRVLLPSRRPRASPIQRSPNSGSIIKRSPTPSAMVNGAQGRRGELAFPQHDLPSGRNAGAAGHDRDHLATQRAAAEHPLSARGADYRDRHQHLNVIGGLVARDPKAVKQAIRKISPEAARSSSSAHR